MSEMIERVKAATLAAWGSFGEVPFLLYDREAEAIARAAIDAMRNPPEQMWDGLARDLVMWARFSCPTGSALHQHLRSVGRPAPEWLLKEIPDTTRVPPKGTVAVCIFNAMLDAVLTASNPGGQS